jgi:hypothetical protein
MRSNQEAQGHVSLMGEIMPFILSVDHERKEVDTVAIGPITYADTVDHLLAERHFEELTYKEFVDARGAGFLWTRDEIREIVAMVRSMSHESKFGPTAILVSSDVAFGMMRMLEALLDDVAEIRPFHDEQEARAWLATKSPA